MNEKRVLALGFFDGVHLGHTALLRKAREQADRLNAPLCVLTFDVHPDEVVFHTPVPLLNSRSDQRSLLCANGADEVRYLHFDTQMMCMPYEAFFQKILIEQLNACHIVCGHDFRFGNKGEGTAQLLRQLCEKNRIGCDIVEAVRFAGQIVCSTQIRSLIEQGQVEQANFLLGHAHFLTGVVEPGKQIGRSLGIPTANICFEKGVLIPKFGVYACRVFLNGESLRAVCNVGTRPTVNGSSVTVEPWLFDFSGDLYGKTLQVSFCRFLRPEQKFDSLDALREQILLDCESARAYFGET